ncbi:autotransporter outer membrane beta-barrel domain-containing protein [Pseudomonas alliivorans]|nr:autotransporter outer membrane beta-barrel domain-containing protein [Pseudomonas alliivorans]MBP0940577.1 autotransporter outer membrane beta-barrel domain-containing protein [Pseudomonas alliivorans]MEE4621544.1 autotransporter outer membrane beta-barrel domain-containing protein [Pseudomonas alliivorans]MEE4636772.1 autotransporter outer membrane beta-barrel domain-containing protein [Pseudomonas alliivorans]MEE4653479.1 autotransporter outer membrane beta-barrel domain-containing protein
MDSGYVEKGILLDGSFADINGATVKGVSQTAIRVGSSGIPSSGSTLKVRSSTVTGAGVGISAGVFSDIDLRATKVYGHAWSPLGSPGYGVNASGSNMVIAEGSYISGDESGIRIIDPASGRLIEKESVITIDNSIVEGIGGASIRVYHRDLLDVRADITVQNGSELLSGNGNLLEVAESSIVDFKVDNSTLGGNLVSDDTSTLNITLQNHASFTGEIINGNTLAVKSGGNWQMVGDNAMRSLSMDGGSVNFAEEGFHTLSLNELSGQGSFGMRVDLDNGAGDLIDVNGQASGQFGLRVRNTGLEVVSSDMEPLKVVHTEGGDAQFSLLGGRVDLGAFSYQLKQQGNDWFIVGEDKVISPSTQSALALFNAAPTVWMSELSTLRTRMGEIRGTGQGGSWMRAYGSRLNATTGDGVDYRQQISGLSLGADAPVEVSNGQLLFGVLGGYSKSDLDLSHGTSGKIDSYYAGAYGTWLADDGYYLDGVLKLNRFRNKAKVAMSDASQAKGDYSNTAVGGWVEFGRHIKLADDYFLEPFAQLSSVVVEGKDYRMDNGLKAKNDRTHSLLGKVGTSAGRSIALKDGGVLQPYVRVALAQEFSRSNDVSVNDAKFDNSLFGSRAELGAGVSVSLSERLQVHADFDYMKGRHVEQPWGANVGVRLAF